MAASPCGAFRAFFGDFLSLLSGTSISPPLSVTIWVLRVMVCLLGAWLAGARRACSLARRRDRVCKRSGRLRGEPATGLAANRPAAEVREPKLGGRRSGAR